MKCTICDDTIGIDEDDADASTSTMCFDCARMLSNTAKKRDKEVGSGPIKTVDNTGRWVQLESHQQRSFMMSLSNPTVEYHVEGENRFNDFDLLNYSFWRMRRYLDQRGFTDVPGDTIEDYAGDVMVEFLQGIEDCKDIKTIHGWHWSLVKARCKKMMTEWVERRQMNIPEDIIDYAVKHQITDPYNWGAASSIDEHESKLPLWTKLSTEHLDLVFANVGVHLTPAEIKTLRYVLGEGRDVKNRTDNTKRKLRRIRIKIEEADPKVWEQVKSVLEVEK